MAHVAGALEKGRNVLRVAAAVVFWVELAVSPEAKRGTTRRDMVMSGRGGARWWCSVPVGGSGCWCVVCCCCSPDDVMERELAAVDDSRKQGVVVLVFADSAVR